MTTGAEHPTPPGRDDGPSSAAHAWERWERVWSRAFYGVLALCLILAVSDTWNGAEAGNVPSGAPGVAILAAMSLMFGLWYRLMIDRRQDCFGLGRATAYLTGAVLFFIALTWLHPSYMFLPFVLYIQLFTFVPIRWAAAGAAPLTYIVWWRGAATDGDPLDLNVTTILIFLGSLGVSVAMGLFIESIIRQSAERQDLIEKLQATRNELATAERWAGMETERQRLAGEIHDTLAQGFTSIVLHLEAADAAIAATPPTSRGVPPPLVHHLDQARQTARDSLAEARRLVWALRPEPLESATLPAALRRVAARWEASAGVPVQVTVTGTVPPLHPDAEVTLLRVAQEALANTRKHADARRVAISLAFGVGTALLDIRDDGVGFTLDEPNRIPTESGGFGLRSMRERVEGLGGTFVVESTPGRGTSIATVVPIRDGAVARTDAAPQAGERT